MPKKILIVLALVFTLLPTPGRASATCSDSTPVTASIDAYIITHANGCVSRTWSPQVLLTRQIVDERTGWESGSGDDFTLVIDGVRLPSSMLAVESIGISDAAEGSTITWFLLANGVASIRRSVTLYRGIAGFATRTS